MKQRIKNIISVIEAAVRWSGTVANVAIVVLVVFVSIDVLVRYVFHYSSPLSFELEWHLYSIMILLGMGYTLQNNGHVRVDIFYERFSEKQTYWVNVLGCVFFLIPFAVVGIIYSLPYAISSYQIGEGTPDPGGLPIWWIIKFFIPLGFLFLLLQALAWLGRLLIKEERI